MYFDPGIGSLIIQALIATLAVIGGYFAIVKTRLKKRFGKNKDVYKKELNDEDDTL